MRVRHGVLLLLIIVAALASMALWICSGFKIRGTSSVALPTTSPLDPANSIPALGQMSSNALPSATNVSAPSPSAASRLPLLLPRELETKMGLAALNDEQVVFYGCVSDQFGRPVNGATVSCTIHVNNGTRVGTERFSLRTDAKGTFTVSGYKGKTLGIALVKEGYVMATVETSFVYSHLWPRSEQHVPNPNKPVVLKMWKLQGDEPLVRIEQKYQLDVTAVPVKIDILAGKLVNSGGDLSLTVDRPSGAVSEQRPQDWGVTLEAVGGGIIETSFQQAKVTYQAPEDGYTPSNVIAVSTTNHWSGLVQRMYFLRSRNGDVYSKLFLSFLINREPDKPATLTLSGYANTNRSRNWEATALR